MVLKVSDPQAQDIRDAYLYCRQRGLVVDPCTAAVAIRTVGDYSDIRSAYVDDVHNAILEYLRDYMEMRSAKAQCKRAIKTGFVDAFETGYVEGGGGDKYDPDPDDSDWLASRQAQELEYINALFVRLKEIKSSASIDEPLTDKDMVAIADRHADLYGRTLDGVYAQGKLRSKKNIMLTLAGTNGVKSCGTCRKYKGQSHRSKWWVAHDLIPTPGNESYECGCYRCEHKLEDGDGNVWAGSLE